MMDKILMGIGAITLVCGIAIGVIEHKKIDVEKSRKDQVLRMLEECISLQRNKNN